MNNFKNEYVDASEYQIKLYIDRINNFIESFGYKEMLGIIKDDAEKAEIEEERVKFMKKNNQSIDFMEIYGTLKNSEISEVYVCCYEPYGDELFCVEKKGNALYFYDISDYKNGVKMNDIDYNDFY